MDDIREQMDLANEISDAISQPVGMGLDLDEDELAAELDQLEQEELDAKLLDTEKVPTTQLPASPGGVLQGLPGVPSTEPGTAVLTEFFKVEIIIFHQLNHSYCTTTTAV
jgi:charged multivesicular body protein 4